MLDRIIINDHIAKNKILCVHTVGINYLICITNIRCMIIFMKFLVQLLYILCTSIFQRIYETRYTMRSLIVWWRTIDKQCYEEGNCIMSKDIIIKEILSNGSIIDSVAVLNINKYDIDFSNL